MKLIKRGLIPARKGAAADLRKGQSIRVINTHGAQVVDTWAFSSADPQEFMSMEHSRAGMSRLSPRIGDKLRTNKRRPIFEVVEDTWGGAHDTLIAACDVYRYEGLGHKGHHDNCTANLAEAMTGAGHALPETPCPLNLFMNIPWTAEGDLTFATPTTKPGDYITLLAQMDCLVVFSACPQDLIPINGAACTPRDAHFEILG
ncbi:MAG: urea carboxylase-associated family protein [Betaproteobacteria bacterium]